MERKVGKETEWGDREKERDIKLSSPLSEDWLLINGPAMETILVDQPDGNAVSSPSSSRRKPPKSAAASSLVGTKSGSIKSNSRGDPKSPRPSSPHGSPSGIQRKASGRSRDRLDVYQQHNGKASPRSTSPSRSSMKKKSGGRSGSPSPRSGSPVCDPHHHSHAQHPSHKEHRDSKREITETEIRSIIKLITSRSQRPRTRYLPRLGTRLGSVRRLGSERELQQLNTQHSIQLRRLTCISHLPSIKTRLRHNRDSGRAQKSINQARDTTLNQFRFRITSQNTVITAERPHGDCTDKFSNVQVSDLEIISADRYLFLIKAHQS